MKRAVDEIIQAHMI